MPSNPSVRRQRYAERYAAPGRASRLQKRAQLEALLGSCCACCGAPDDLQVDHVHPTGQPHKTGAADVILKRVLADPGAYQLLCRHCNRWKDTGPRCPCSWWDTVEPGWRTRAQEAALGKALGGLA